MKLKTMVISHASFKKASISPPKKLQAFTSKAEKIIVIKMRKSSAFTINSTLLFFTTANHNKL